MTQLSPTPGGRATAWRRAIARRLALDAWFPHVPIALLVAPVGLLMLGGATRRTLGVGVSGVDLAALERGAGAFGRTPLIEAALGTSLIAISIGLALRARLAWLWAVAATVAGLAIRLYERDSLADLTYLAAMLAVLLAYRRRFSNRDLVSSSVFAATALATFMMWATLATLRLGAHFAPPIEDLTTAFYFTVSTISSVGFGDIVADDSEGRIFVALMILIGIVVGATAFSTILLPLLSGSLRRIFGGRSDVDRSNHYVVVGKSALARNTTTELERRGEHVTLVLETAPEDDFFKQRDVVVGDPTDLSVLRTAGVERARGVLALSTDDAENGFVVLGVNELDPNVRTVAALNDAKNEFRIKRTQPSLLLSLQALGGELLAMALTGERVDVQAMLRRVLQLHDEPATTPAQPQPPSQTQPQPQPPTQKGG